MDIQKIIAELREERAQIEEAIYSLERLSAAHGKRRGRPPKWLSEVKAAVTSEGRAATKRRKRGSKPKQSGNFRSAARTATANMPEST